MCNKKTSSDIAPDFNLIAIMSDPSESIAEHPRAPNGHGKEAAYDKYMHNDLMDELYKANVLPTSDTSRSLIMALDFNEFCEMFK
jgi:hypothetical protein